MPECAYKNRIVNMPRVLNMTKFWKEKVLNMAGFSIF